MKQSVFRKGLFCLLVSAGVLGNVPACDAQEMPKGWNDSLESMKKEGVFPDDKGDLHLLRLVDYTYKGLLKTEKKKSQVIEAMYADEAPIPSVSSQVVVSDTTITATDTIINRNVYPKFEILTVRQLTEKGALPADSVAAIKQRLKNYLTLGTGHLELVWNYKGKEYRTTGVLIQGVPLDSFTMGLFTGKHSTTRKSVHQEK